VDIRFAFIRSIAHMKAVRDAAFGVEAITDDRKPVHGYASKFKPVMNL